MSIIMLHSIRSSAISITLDYGVPLWSTLGYCTVPYGNCRLCHFCFAFCRRILAFSIYSSLRLRRPCSCYSIQLWCTGDATIHTYCAHCLAIGQTCTRHTPMRSLFIHVIGGSPKIQLALIAVELNFQFVKSPSRCHGCLFWWMYLQSRLCPSSE